MLLRQARWVRHLFATAVVAGLSLAFLSACSSDEPMTAGDPQEATTRTVEGAYGAIEIPSEPKRIMADLMTVDYLTALGVDTSTIVGVFEADSFAKDSEHYLNDFFTGQDLVDPGFQFEMNLESIVAASPDLILLPFDQIDGAEQQRELGRIAPLLVVPTADGDDPDVRYGGHASFQDWRSTLRSYGELLDREDEAEAFIDETDARLEEVRTEHGDLIDAVTATQAKSTPDYMAINLLSAAEESGVLGTIVMSELGFRPPPQQASIKPDQYGGKDLSAENVDLVDGDVLFLEVRDGSTWHTESPLWDTLEVVRNDAVYPVGNHWEFGGAVAARQVVEDIDAALDDLEPEAS